MEISTTSHLARRLGTVLEPVVGQVYFSPECHANYVALGFDPSPGDANGVALPDGPAYFASRGSLLGQVPGEVIAGHVEYEYECGKCHQRFNKAAQNGLCLDCHKDTARDVET